MKEEHEQAAEGEQAHDGHDHGDIDPHAFQSIANAKIYVKNIADAFCAADAAGCDTYKANADAYTAKLDAADAEVKAAVAAIPEEKRTIITSHDAFGYFEHAYGLTFLAPEGISTEAEASAADVAALISQVRSDKASAIFVENITNPRLIEQIATETGVKVGGTLYSDALSKADGPAATYIDMMKSNIGTIRRRDPRRLRHSWPVGVRAAAIRRLPLGSDSGRTGADRPRTADNPARTNMEYRQITDDYSVSAQIAPEEVAAIKAAGFKSVICNRPDNEQPGQPSADSVKAAVEAAGLAFRYIPVISGQMTGDNVADDGRSAGRDGRPGLRLLPFRHALHQPLHGDPADQGLIGDLPSGLALEFS